MSDVQRSFNRTRKSSGPRRRVRRGGGCGLWFAFPVLVLFLVMGVWAVWTTRDTHSMARLIPAGQRYEVYVDDFLERRGHMAESRVWELVDEQWPLHEAPELLMGNFGLPDWVLNNVLFGLCHVSGSDLASFSDPLFVTRMSRVGVLIERLRFLVPYIAEDYAGGLRLRAIPEAGLFYAVRGRILMVSPARTALIRALTLAESDALSDAALERGAKSMGTEDLTCHVRPRDGETLAAPFEEVRVGIRLGTDGARLSCHGDLRPAWRDRLGPLLAHAHPGPLPAPIDGLCMVSANMGLLLPEIWGGVNQALGDEIDLNVWRERALAVSRTEQYDFAPLLSAMVAEMGPEMRLSWHGIDQYAMLPVPELVGIFEAPDETLATLFASAAEASEGAPPWVSLPRYDAEKRLFWVPAVGGPSIEATAALAGNALLLSTSRTIAEELAGQSMAGEALPQQGNVYVRVKPHASVLALLEAARQFAELGVLRGYTVESLDAMAAPWLAWAERVEEAAAVAGHDEGKITFSLRLSMRQGEPEA